MGTVMHKRSLYSPPEGLNLEARPGVLCPGLCLYQQLVADLSGGQPRSGCPWGKSVVGEPVGTWRTGAAGCPRRQLGAGHVSIGGREHLDCVDTYVRSYAHGSGTQLPRYSLRFSLLLPAVF